MGRRSGHRGGYPSDGEPITQLPKAPPGPAPGSKATDAPSMGTTWTDEELRHIDAVHTCGPGCRVVAIGDQDVDHFGWPADYRGPLPQLGCGLVCVPELTCGGCPRGTPANPVDAKPVHADVGRSAAPSPSPPARPRAPATLDPARATCSAAPSTSDPRRPP